MSLVRVEMRRFTSRRAVRAIMAVVLLGVILGSVLTFLHSNRNFSAATARERARAAAEYQGCLRDVRAGNDIGEGGKCIEPDLAAVHADPRFHLKALTDVLGNLSGSLIVLGLALGATFVGAEWHHRTMTVELTWNSRRVRVGLAKIGACAAVVFGGALAMQLLFSAGLVPAAVLRGATDGTTGAWLAGTIGVGIRGALVAGMAASMGAALAMLVRSTAVAIGIFFVWLSVLEGILRQLRPGWRSWLIGNNTAGFVTGGTDASRSELASGILLLLYAAALAWVSLVSFRRRDLA